MPDQLYLLGNLVIMVAYAAITVAIAVPVARAGQLRSNKLAGATALIFFSCAVGHGLHALMAYLAILRNPRMPGMPMTASSHSWWSAGWDLFTAAVGIYYWTLRRGYGVLFGKGAIYIDPWGQRRLDEADARERAAQDVAESHRATLTAVVESTDDAIIGATLDGTVTAWNGGAERLFGYPADEIIGRRLAVLACDDAGDEEQAAALARIARGERGVHYDTRRRHKDGSSIDVSVSVSPIRELHGSIIGVSAVARDITAANEAAERQRAIEERTHQAQRMESLGKLAGGVAHDFNNILAIIANYTEFAAEQSAGNPAVHSDLAHVRTATERAIGLTHQLLTFTRGDTIQPQDVDLNSAIAEVQAMLGRTIGEHITLITVPAPAPLTVHADAGQIQQVLLNLAINARDAMPDGGTLVIGANPAELDGHEVLQPAPAAGCYARLVISDTGEGMPPDVAEHIFEPFFTTKPRGQGTGLGLSTVYGIVTEAGGSINVVSEPGVGTTFRVYLPITASDGVPVPIRTAGDRSPDGEGRTVLVVEDEPALARVVARILAGGGYRVRSAVNGPEALAMHAEHDCDLLLTDVIMPEMSGRRLADLLRQRRPDLPVLYMSGYSNGLLGPTNVLDQDIAFIEKPFTQQELLLKVHEVLTVAGVDRRIPDSSVQG